MLLSAMPGLSQDQIFLDSNVLDNLNNLRSYVNDSDCVVLLLTRNVLTRPYVLLELYTATQAGVPIIILQMDGSGGHAGEKHKIADFLRSFPEYCAGDGHECAEELAKRGISPTEMRDVLLQGLQITEESSWNAVGKHTQNLSLREKRRLNTDALKAEKWRDVVTEAKKVLTFSAHASDTIKRTQVHALTKTLVALVCPENAILQALQDVASDERTEVQLEAGKSILVIHDDHREAVEQAGLLKAWLAESTDLEDKQLLAMEGLPSPPDRGSGTPGEIDQATSPGH
jgi:cytochrome c-type biogenesis protein CcmH/NrfF